MNPENETYEVKACAPADLSPEELAVCIAIITSGDAVDPISANRELPLATVAVAARAEGAIVGVGVIKRLRPDYASKIERRSGVSLDPNIPELGYVAVDKDHWGQRLSPRIVAELLSKHEGSLFATTFDDRMKKTLSKAGFVQKGGQWKGKKGWLSLWVKE